MNYLKICTILYVMSLCSCTGIKSLSFARPIKSDTGANLIVKPQERAAESSPKVKNLGNIKKPNSKAPDNKQPVETKEPEILPVETKEPEILPVETKEPEILPVETKEPEKNSGLKPKLPEREAIIPPK
ncbi:MAG: hypothetical protein ACJ0KA_02475 [Verrucomicrobiales bacterium]